MKNLPKVKIGIVAAGTVSRNLCLSTEERLW